MRIKEIFGNKSLEILSLYSRPEAYDKMYELIPQEIYLMEHWRPIIIGIIKKYCKDKNILDLGCGTGIFTVKIKECTNNIVLGLDSNKQYLCFAKSKNKKLDLILADVHNIPLKRETTDVIVSTGLFEYIDRGVVIKQIYEILKTDGICIISVPNKYSAGRLIGRLIHEFLGKRRREKEPSKQEMLDLFKKNGFKLISYTMDDGLIWLPDTVDKLCGIRIYLVIEKFFKLFGQNPFSNVMLFICKK